MKPALFLDRDGVLMEDRHYVDTIDNVAIIPGAEEAVRRANEAGWWVVVVSNQSGVARGLMTETSVETIHEFIRQTFAAKGARIDRFYFCPHHDEHGVGVYKVECECRKPKPGMLLRATEELKIDLGQSWLVGDRLTDLQAANNAGCRSILVRTGYGEKVLQSELDSVQSLIADVPSIVEAVERIFNTDQR